MTAVLNTATTVPQLQPSDFVTRLAALIPNNWASEDAKQSGVFNMILAAVGTETASMIAELNYALAATRIATETDPELSLAAQDFFGPGNLPRPAGYSDTQYASYIKANLFKTGVTRAAIQAFVTAILGVAPRMIEPWRLADTSVVGMGYLDVDSAALPGRVGMEQQRYTGLIEFAATPAEQAAVQSAVVAAHAYGTAIFFNLVT